MSKKGKGVRNRIRGKADWTVGKMYQCEWSQKEIPGKRRDPVESFRGKGGRGKKIVVFTPTRREGGAGNSKTQPEGGR